MAKNEVVSRVFSQLELDALEAHKRAIIDIDNKREGLAVSLAYHLWDISVKGLFEIETKQDGTPFKGIGDYAEYTFGIAKGTTSDAVNTFERFGNRETQSIADKWADYKFSNLMVLKKLSDDEIAIAGITSADSKASIKDKLQHLKIEQSKVAMLPDKRKSTVEAWNGIVERLRTRGEDNGDVKEFFKECADSFTGKVNNHGEPDIAILNYDELEKLSTIIKRYNGMFDKEESASDSTIEPEDNVSHETPDSTVEPEQDTEEQKADVVMELPANLVAKLLRTVNKEIDANVCATRKSGDTILIKVV